MSRHASRLRQPPPRANSHHNWDARRFSVRSGPCKARRHNRKDVARLKKEVPAGKIFPPLPPARSRHSQRHLRASSRGRTRRAEKTDSQAGTPRASRNEDKNGSGNEAGIVMTNAVAAATVLTRAEALPCMRRFHDVQKTNPITYVRQRTDRIL
ncbi:hypothetical protein SKTS_21160 [Sulfurimicrobium lacus]|uniref:Uncharacterized protein n=1 Tax=Sulfurimicrobium lacus TaxID=2715678 RepID=A0A6F8VD19_9PROT|nr:hypothetical protein SKTS_21160 [Sulfurimicrobium lacus]